jgi:hypothetical protein
MSFHETLDDTRRASFSPYALMVACVLFVFLYVLS